jgi:hypothetical protein
MPKNQLLTVVHMGRNSEIKVFLTLKHPTGMNTRQKESKEHAFGW